MIHREKGKIVSIFEAMVDGVYVIDRDFNIEYMNEVMISNFGQGVSRKCYQVIHCTDKICPWCRAEDVFRGRTVHWACCRFCQESWGKSYGTRAKNEC